MSSGGSSRQIQPLESSLIINSAADDPIVIANNKRSRASEVWDYFSKVDWGNNTDIKTAQCIVSNCKHKPFSCGKEGSTRTLWRHLPH
jgi:hypothetical protein